MKIKSFNKQTKNFITSAFLLTALYVSPSIATQYSGINKITFTESKYNKDFVGNGFLIEHLDKLYAVTVKHTLLEARSPKMSNVVLTPHIKDWIIHPNQSPKEYVRLGKLINANQHEAIDMKVLEKDWLVFEVLENKSSLQVLKLRETPLRKGENLSAYGCSYANKATCTQDSYRGEYMQSENNNLRVSMPDLDLTKLRGLSGSPVLDSNGQVVGIVSNVLQSKSGKGFDFAPANLNYLRSVLN